MPNSAAAVAVARGRVSGAFNVRRAAGEAYPSIRDLELATDEPLPQRRGNFVLGLNQVPVRFRAVG